MLSSQNTFCYTDFLNFVYHLVHTFASTFDVAQEPRVAMQCQEINFIFLRVL